MTNQERVCSVAGCTRTQQAHGYCNAHYQRWRTHGDPLATVPIGDLHITYGRAIAPLPSPLTSTERHAYARTMRVACDGADGAAGYWRNDAAFWDRCRRLDAVGADAPAFELVAD